MTGAGRLRTAGLGAGLSSSYDIERPDPELCVTPRGSMMSMPRIRILPIVFMSRMIPCCALFPEIEPGFFDFADDLIQPHVLMQDLTPETLVKD